MANWRPSAAATVLRDGCSTPCTSGRFFISLSMSGNSDGRMSAYLEHELLGSFQNLRNLGFEQVEHLGRDNFRHELGRKYRLQQAQRFGHASPCIILFGIVLG